MPRHIGIVACSSEGAALCYRTVCLEGAALFGPHGHPEISLHAHSLAEYVARLDQSDWDGVGELMLSSAEKLAQTGCEFLICPDNTIHGALSVIAHRLPIAWLHIADAVAAEAARRGFHRLGLLGTRWLVESDVYPERLALHGLRVVPPEAAEISTVHRIIMEDLVRNVVNDAALAEFRNIIARMQDAGCDAVVLGCTEIPLLVNDSNSPLPTLDSTRLLARAALRVAAATVLPAGELLGPLRR